MVTVSKVLLAAVYITTASAAALPISEENSPSQLEERSENTIISKIKFAKKVILDTKQKTKAQEKSAQAQKNAQNSKSSKESETGKQKSTTKTTKKSNKKSKKADSKESKNSNYKSSKKSHAGAAKSASKLTSKDSSGKAKSAGDSKKKATSKKAKSTGDSKEKSTAKEAKSTSDSKEKTVTKTKTSSKTKAKSLKVKYGKAGSFNSGEKAAVESTGNQEKEVVEKDSDNDKGHFVSVAEGNADDVRVNLGETSEKSRSPLLGKGFSFYKSLNRYFYHRYIYLD